MCTFAHACMLAWVHLCQRAWDGDLVVGWLSVSVGGCVWMCFGVSVSVYVYACACMSTHMCKHINCFFSIFVFFHHLFK